MPDESKHPCLGLKPGGNAGRVPRFISLSWLSEVKRLLKVQWSKRTMPPSPNNGLKLPMMGPLSSRPSDQTGGQAFSTGPWPRCQSDLWGLGLFDALGAHKRPPTAGPQPRPLWLMLMAPRSSSQAAPGASRPSRPGAAGPQAAESSSACNGEAREPTCNAPNTTRIKHKPHIAKWRALLFCTRLRFARLSIG